MQAKRIEILQSPWLIELGAFYMNVNEPEGPNLFSSSFSCDLNAAEPVITLMLPDSVKSEYNLKCAICLVTEHLIANWRQKHWIAPDHVLIDSTLLITCICFGCIRTLFSIRMLWVAAIFFVSYVLAQLLRWWSSKVLMLQIQSPSVQFAERLVCFDFTPSLNVRLV